MTVTPDIAAAIDAWVPTRHNIDPAHLSELIERTRALVTAAEPRKVTEAKLACGHVLRYLAWTADNNHAELTADTLATYVDELRSNGATSGTIKPTLFFLRRCTIPGNTFTTATKNTPARTESATRSDQRELAVEAALAAYTPKATRIRPLLWEQIAEQARTAVANTNPPTPGIATSRLAPTSLYLAWATKHLTDDDSIFTPRHIDEFIDIATTAWGQTTHRTYVSQLRRVAAAARPDLFTTKTRTGAHLETYTTDELDTIIRSIHGRTWRPRRHLSAAVLLARGAGIIGTDATSIRPGDIEPSPAATTTVTITVTGGRAPRTVPVYDAWAPAARNVATVAELNHDTYLLGGTSQKRDNRQATLWNDHAQLTGVAVEPARLRNTWLAWLVRQPLPLTTILNRAGLTTAASLDAALRSDTIHDDDTGQLAQLAELAWRL